MRFLRAPSNRWPVVGAMLHAFSLGGCSSAPDADPSSEVAQPSGFTIADSVDATFGWDQDSLGYDLSTYTHASLLSDGRVAVLCCNQTVMIFSVDGRRIAAFGGRGDGPEQFRFARMTVLAGDTILIYDSTRRRTSWIHPDAGFVRSSQFSTDVPTYWSTPLGVRSDGAVLLSSLHTFSDSRNRSTADSARTMAEVTALLPGRAPEALFGVPDLSLVSRVPPMGPEGAYTMDLVRYGGQASIRVSGDVAYIIPGGSRRLEIRELNGNPIRAFELLFSRNAVTAEDRASYIEAETAPLRDQSLGGHAPPPNLKASLEFLETAVFADSFPMADDLFLDVGGDGLWVLHGRPHGASDWRATKLSLSGEAIGAVEMNLPNARPLAFLGNSVLLARVDQDGVTWFELRQLIPAVPSPRP